MNTAPTHRAPVYLSDLLLRRVRFLLWAAFTMVLCAAVVSWLGLAEPWPPHSFINDHPWATAPH